MNIHEFMMRAIELSEKNVNSGGGPFGAVIVKNNKIIGEGKNSVVKLNDPTAHAEVMAIRNACTQTNSFDLSGSVIFSSCEPCPMCLAAIWWARIEKVYYGNTKIDASKIGFDDNEIYCELTRPITQRKLPMQQALPDESIKAFKIWQNNQNKITY